MGCNFRTKAYNINDAHKYLVVLIINLAAVKLSAIKLITLFNSIKI